MFCAECGQQIIDGSRFCKHCGSAASQGKATQPVGMPFPAQETRGGSPSSAPYEKAEYEVPHCHFEPTPEGGFKVSYKNRPLWYYRLFMDPAKMKGFIGLAFFLSLFLIPFLVEVMGVGFGKSVIVAVFALFVAPFVLVHRRTSTQVEVTKDAVIIDGKSLRRSDFVGFNVGTMWTVPDQPHEWGTLGYRYGNRSFNFGGAWSALQAPEVASALNSHLRQSRQAGDDQRPEPDQLRSERPTDF